MWDIRNLTPGPVNTYHVGVGGPVLFEVDADKIVGINCYYRVVQWDLVTKERVILLKLPLMFSERDRAPCSLAMDYRKLVASWEHNVSLYSIQ